MAKIFAKARRDMYFQYLLRALPSPKGHSMRISAHLFLLGCCAMAIPAAASSLAQACTGTLLHAAPAAIDARAVWLNERLAKWPGAGDGGAFKLYHSPNGGIVATPGGAVRGAAGALTLLRHEGALDPAAAARFGYLGAGPTLALDDADLAQMPALHRAQLVLVHEDAGGSVRMATRLQAAGALDALFAAAAGAPGLGALPDAHHTAFGLWAPTAQQVTLC